MKFKCERHKTNSGWYDENNDWHCWKCTYEDYYHFPRGKIIERAIRGNYELRILNTGKEKELILELWNLKTKRLEHDSVHNYLSTIRREFNNLLEEIESRILNKTVMSNQAQLNYTFGSNLSSSSTSYIASASNSNLISAIMYFRTNFIDRGPQIVLDRVYFVECRFSEEILENISEELRDLDCAKFIDCYIVNGNEEYSIPNSDLTVVEREAIDARRRLVGNNPEMLYCYFREGDLR
ncbi:MAG: hypothetical protein QXK24_00035 [Ignisphaera sp.]